MLTNKYLNGIPEGSRAAQGKSLDPSLLTEASLKHVRALDRMARARGQSLAQMALAWALRDNRVTSVLIGASSVAQLDDSLDAVQNLDVHRRGAGRDRRARRRRRHQPVEAVLQPLRRAPEAVGTRPSQAPPAGWSLVRWSSQSSPVRMRAYRRALSRPCRMNTIRRSSRDSSSHQPVSAMNFVSSV